MTKANYKMLVRGIIPWNYFMELFMNAPLALKNVGIIKIFSPLVTNSIGPDKYFCLVTNRFSWFPLGFYVFLTRNQDFLVEPTHFPCFPIEYS